jgi:subtilisin family serine protease
MAGSNLPPGGPPPAMADVPPEGEEPRRSDERIKLNLVKTVIALPLLDELNAERRKAKGKRRAKPTVYSIIIDLNLEYPEGRAGARTWVISAIDQLIREKATPSVRDQQSADEARSQDNPQYVFARLEGELIRALVLLDAATPKAVMPGRDTARVNRAIYQVWKDFEIFPLLFKSIATVKADAARRSFASDGHDIVWAVIDSGIEAGHAHFQAHDNLGSVPPDWHHDFTPEGSPLADGFGHGTHVAGIIGGEVKPLGNDQPHPSILAYSRTLKADGQQAGRDIEYDLVGLPSISGVAPRTKLVSLKVLDKDGRGAVSNIIAALGHIHRINNYGRYLRIHGVNLSVGYPFDPEWFACGQSQLCVEVDRLVRTGVVVVAAAGNSGYGTLSTSFTGLRTAGLMLTINDPGNAGLAITVGATHRDMPHIYGVSYFSSKGPTGDGRSKPDLVAPGEKILSCAAGKMKEEIEAKVATGVTYLEHSGTSMAAPHVSGVIAAFLSARNEFIGQPERVKEIFTRSATDLGRERYFQGHGLVDLMRAIQSV